MTEVSTRVAEGDTYCNAFGHRWGLMKAYGHSYMQCEICKAVRSIQVGDLPRVSESSEPLPKERPWPDMSDLFEAIRARKGR